MSFLSRLLSKLTAKKASKALATTALNEVSESAEKAVTNAISKNISGEIANVVSNGITQEASKNISNSIANVVSNGMTQEASKNISNSIANGASNVVAKTGSGGSGGKIPTSKVTASASDDFGTNGNGNKKTFILYRGQRKGNDNFYYNKGDGTTGSETVGNGLFMTPNKKATETWSGEGVSPIQIEVDPDDVLSLSDLKSLTKMANENINNESLMSELSETDPDLANFYENLAEGRLQEVSKYLDKPFIVPDSGQGQELNEHIFFPDTRPSLTRDYREKLMLDSKSGNSALSNLIKETDNSSGYIKEGWHKFNEDLTFSKGRGNWGHSGRKGQVGGSEPKVQMSPSYDHGYGGGFSDNAKSIGNGNVAPVDESTLPEKYEFYKEITAKNKAKYGYVYDSVSKATGKPATRITKEDLKTYLEENYPDYVMGDEKTKYDYEIRIQDAIEDEIADEAYEKGTDLSSIVHNKYSNAGISDIYNDHSGRVGMLDRELSKRLGIGESTSAMSDRLLKANPSVAGGDAVGDMYSVNVGDSWVSDEQNLAVAAHERMHVLQNQANGFDYKQVQPAYNELHDELQEAMLGEDELRKAHEKNFAQMGGMRYWGSSVEQEARMVEAYLYEEGFTTERPDSYDEYKDKMDIIKPAFEKFFDKLRKLSEAGVALPAVAIASLFGLASSSEQDESVDNLE